MDIKEHFPKKVAAEANIVTTAPQLSSYHGGVLLVVVAVNSDVVAVVAKDLGIGVGASGGGDSGGDEKGDYDELLADKHITDLLLNVDKNNYYLKQVIVSLDDRLKFSM